MTNKYIFGYENWQKHYASLNHKERKKVWAFIKTSANQDVYLREYDSWLSMQSYIDSHNLNIVAIGLRYKSNSIEVDAKNSDGVYLVKSVKGQFGGETKQCFTTGILKDGKITKTLWITPELLEDHTYTDKVEDSFEEAIVYHGKKT